MSPSALATSALALALVSSPEPIPALRVDLGRMVMKATPQIEGGIRVIYLEASVETRDQDGERILTSALHDSIPWFLRYGKIDLDHATETGRIHGIKVDPYAYEIGRPVDARVDGNAIYVKAEIYSASDPANKWTQSSNEFWDSLQCKPPVIWYPSVAGSVYVDGEASVIDPDGRRTTEIRRMRWHSIGLSRTPVNTAVAPVSMVPLRVFAKAFQSGQAGMSDLLDMLAGHKNPAAPGIGADLNVGSVKTVLELLADQMPGVNGPKSLIARAQARGVSPDHTAAIIAAVLEPIHA